ncbi:PadR family transcriptional regulator [Paenarthrobacter nitroguajacolicus]|uniref:PadR family transcriptional regulator n=1 Tax=Paenarthrobacter nitroguajacolicus TaxID=211146 RepID=UPI003AE500B0
MREPTFMVLSALAQGPQHGYALLAETKRLSDGRVALQSGTLYASLDRLREEGLVIVVREEVVGSSTRTFAWPKPAFNSVRPEVWHERNTWRAPSVGRPSTVPSRPVQVSSILCDPFDEFRGPVLPVTVGIERDPVQPTQSGKAALIA